MLSHMGAVCDTHENSGILCGISYMKDIGQCDLINTCFKLPQVWYTPGKQHVWNKLGDFYKIDFYFN